jgi:hypothetical protein
MKARGYDVQVVSSPGKDLDSFGACEQISADAIAMTRRITPLRDLVAVRRLWRWFRRSRPEIVHTHTPKGGLLSMIGAWLARVPVPVYHIHGLRMMTATGLKRPGLAAPARPGGARARLGRLLPGGTLASTVPGVPTVAVGPWHREPASRSQRLEVGGQKPEVRGQVEVLRTSDF